MQRKYLNIKFINQIMEERGITVKQIVEGSDFSERRIKNYLQGNLPKKVPLLVAVLFCIKLNIGFNDILTTDPPSLPSPFIKGEGGCEADG